MTYHSSIPARTTIQAYLTRRQISQVLSRSQEEREALTHLAARAFLPKNGMLTFASPLQKLGDVVLTVLSRRIFIRHDDCTVEQIFVRGFTGQLDPNTAETFWGPASSEFCVNLACWMQAKGEDPVLSTERTARARMALDLDRECARCAYKPFPFPGYPILPPTLLAFPLGTQFVPERTAAVLTRAENDRISWEDAWHRLYNESLVPDSVNRTGFALIDSRLCTRVKASPGWVGSLGEYHDLRQCINRAVFNPIRDGALPSGLTDQQAAARLRHRLPPDYGQVCSDANLLTAAKNPRMSLIIPGLPKIQVWRPPLDGAKPESFQFAEPGHRADLWSIKPEYLNAPVDQSGNRHLSGRRELVSTVGL